MSSTGNPEKTYAQQVRIMPPCSHTLLRPLQTSGACSTGYRHYVTGMPIDVPTLTALLRASQRGFRCCNNV
jgi:hypothetical protein